MRLLLVLALVAVACAGTIVQQSRELPNRVELMSKYFTDLLDESEIEYVHDPEDGTVEIAPSFILSWQLRRYIRKVQKQMPCGFPDYGIPPLAPVRITETSLNYEKGIFETLNELFRFRIDGLDSFKINKFKLNMIFSKITFDFTFPILKANAQSYDTNTLIDALQQLGVSVRYEGNGSLDFGLTNLRISGVLRYKIPILWGSIKITSLRTTITLGGCNSNITGFIGDGSINHAINRQLENFVESTINDNQLYITDKIEETVVPRVNRMLKGNNFWTLLDMILSSVAGENENDPIFTKCVPPADPWA